MKIAVAAANGRAGKLITNELVARGNDVTAIVRGENGTDAQAVIKKDIMDLTAEDLAPFDVVVDAFGQWQEDRLSEHSATLMHLCDVLSGADTRLAVVGGAGSLYVDPEHTTMLSDTPDFPAEFLPLAKAQGKALEELRARDDVKWTFVSPAADFQADGGRTGEYLLGGEELMSGSEGPVISYADYAIAMADEVEHGDHIQERISVVRK